MTQALFRHRRVLVILVHAGLIVLSNYLAFWLRFDGAIPDAYWAVWLETVPWLWRSGPFSSSRLTSMSGCGSTWGCLISARS